MGNLYEILEKSGGPTEGEKNLILRLGSSYQTWDIVQKGEVMFKKLLLSCDKGAKWEENATLRRESCCCP